MADLIPILPKDLPDAGDPTGNEIVTLFNDQNRFRRTTINKILGLIKTATQSFAGLMSANDKQKLDEFITTVTPSIIGVVNSDGSLSFAKGRPVTVKRITTGQYSITHNFGKYPAVLLTPIISNMDISYLNMSVNMFYVDIDNNVGAPIDGGFSFVVFEQ